VNSSEFHIACNPLLILMSSLWQFHNVTRYMGTIAEATERVTRLDLEERKFCSKCLHSKVRRCWYNNCIVGVTWLYVCPKAGGSGVTMWKMPLVCVPNTCCRMQLPFSSDFIRESLQQRAASNVLLRATDLLHATAGSSVQHTACCTFLPRCNLDSRGCIVVLVTWTSYIASDEHPDDVFMSSFLNWRCSLLFLWNVWWTTDLQTLLQTVATESSVVGNLIGSNSNIPRSVNPSTTHNASYMSSVMLVARGILFGEFRLPSLMAK
jgi:hypothetical protein